MSEREISLLDQLQGLENEKADLQSQLAESEENLADLYAERETVLTEIDGRISISRDEKQKIIDQRRIVDEKLGLISVGSVITEIASSPMEWSGLWYERIKISWGRYGVEVPPFEEVAGKLASTQEAITELETDLPDLKGKMGPLLVPPSNTKLPMELKDRAWRVGAKYKSTASENWRVLAVMLSEKSLDWGAQDILQHKLFQIGKLDTRQLGPDEYSALVHQGPHFDFEHYRQGIIQLPAIDRSGYTILLKNYLAYKDETWQGEGVLTAHYDDGRYHLSEGMVSFNSGFRPAVEV